MNPGVYPQAFSLQQELFSLYIHLFIRFMPMPIYTQNEGRLDSSILAIEVIGLL